MTRPAWAGARIAAIGALLMLGTLVLPGGPAARAQGSGAGDATAAPVADATIEPVAPQTGASPTVVQKVVLTAVGATTGPTRSYVARVLDADGTAIAGARLDLGALGSDPDDRVVTVPMEADPADPTRYGVSVTYPAAGDWVIVVRVFEPSRFVHLGSEKVDVGALPKAGHSSPSREALASIAPDFGARYDPYTGVGATGVVPTTVAGAVASSGHGDSGGIVAADERHTSDGLLTEIVMKLVHAGGAMAWVIGMLGLSLARRLRPSAASAGIVRWVADRYLVLVGGGLLGVVLSGVMSLERSTPTGLDIGALLDTNLGTVYFGVLGVKLALAASSVVLSAQIGTLLRSQRSDMGSLSLRSVGAAASRPPRLERALRLADINTIMAVGILVCVVVLTNVHRALH